MMERRKQVAKITGIVNRGEAVGVIEALSEHGIVDAHLAVGRSDVLHDKKWLFGASERTVIDEDPIEILTFLVDPALEDAALKLVLHAGRLGIAGRGMAFSETVELLWAHELCAENRTADFTVASDIPLLSDLALVCCIAQRGEGDRMAMISLDTGTCVPAITFGQGTGAPTDIDLGSVAASSTAVSQTGSNTFKVNCSRLTPFHIGLAPSVANGGDSNGNGKMASVANSATNTDKVPYTLYQDSGYATAWGNTATPTADGNGKGGTGAGMAVANAIMFTAYAKATNSDYAPDDYKDTVTVNVNY